MTDKTHPTAPITRDEMKAWLDETIKLEAGSDACFPNQKFSQETVAKAIRDELSRTPTIPAGMKSAGDWAGYIRDCDRTPTHEKTDNGIPLLSDIVRMIQQDALSAAPTPPSNGGWKPIEEAPKDGTSFLAYSKGSISIDWKDKRQHKNSPFFWREYPTERYTHFMPLPFPPESPKEDSK